MSNYRGITKLMSHDIQWDNKTALPSVTTLFLANWYNFPLNICSEFQKLFLLLFEIGLTQHNQPWWATLSTSVNLDCTVPIARSSHLLCLHNLCTHLYVVWVMFLVLKHFSQSVVGKLASILGRSSITGGKKE